MPADRDPAPDIGERKLSTLRGVGPALEQALARLGIERVADLWFHLPLRYEDRTRVTPIRDLVSGAPAQVEGAVAACERGFRFRPQLRVALTDASGGTLLLRFFHFRAAQADQLAPGTRLRVYGDVRAGPQGLEIVHPNYQRLGDEAVVEQAQEAAHRAFFAGDRSIALNRKKLS